MKETAMAHITCTITLDVTYDDGSEPNETALVDAKYALQHAIKTRVFGQGFLPDYVEADNWNVIIH